MKKYLIVSEGSASQVESDCLTRAKDYAEEMLSSEKPGTVVHVYVKHLQAVNSGISWGVTTPIKKQKRRSPEFPENEPRNKFWTTKERDQMIAMCKEGRSHEEIAERMSYRAKITAPATG